MCSLVEGSFCFIWGLGLKMGEQLTSKSAVVYHGFSDQIMELFQEKIVDDIYFSEICGII
jgi:hypothetical protein